MHVYDPVGTLTLIINCSTGFWCCDADIYTLSSYLFFMKVSELRDKSPIEELKVTISELGETRDTSYGKVQSTTAKDDSGTVQLSLWNDQIGKFDAGDVVVIKKGWSKEYRGQMQVSAGKFGTLEKVE
jgi:replication factor A1